MMNDDTIRTIARAAAQREVSRLLGLQGMDSVQYQTVDATPVTVTTIELEPYTGGIVTVEVVGKNDTGVSSVTGEQKVRYDKTTGLALGTPVDVVALETDMVGATFSIIAASDNIAVQVTGTTDVINWTVRTKHIYSVATNTP